MTNADFIPYARQWIDEEDIQAVAEVLRSVSLTTGPTVARFGEAVAKVAGTKYAVAIANGTLAAAVGLGLQLWLPGLVLWIVGHSLAVWGARLDPQFMQVFSRHVKHRQLLDV